MDIKDWLPEFKVSAESDEHLKDYFLKTNSLKNITDEQRWLVLGRKGTGKTALYEYLCSAKPSEINDFNVIPLNFRAYPWPIHNLYKDSLEGELNAFQKSWEYLIVTKSLIKLIEIKKDDLNKELKTCKKYIETIYGNPDPTLVEIIKSKIARIDELTLPTLEAMEALSFSLGAISFEDIPDNDKLKNKLKSNAFTLTTYFNDVLNRNIGDIKLLLVFDQLDEAWLSEEINTYSKVLANLVNVANSINNNLSLNKNLKPVVFLRSDIYETLKFNDKTKVFEDSAIEITWDEDSLNKMFWQRINKYKPKDVELKRYPLSNSIFEVKSVRHGATPFKHILRRSFYRPRDIITYLNKVRQGHVETSSGLYSSKDLYNAESSYSQTIYNELLDEWSNQLPEITQYLGILQSIGVQTFDYKTFYKTADKEIENFSRSKAQDILKFLFKNSIIGQKVNVNWEYIATNPFLQISYDKAFHVNNGLKQRLVLTEQRTDRK